jgi:hypothetical protein
MWDGSMSMGEARGDPRDEGGSQEGEYVPMNSAPAR